MLQLDANVREEVDDYVTCRSKELESVELYIE